ncbi:MAG: patatin-like phospholipase family protein [Deltaproteobacteria bacterium]|nr:patatin-like phospholipase family protein [Deltaproteobacteria bacterium]
MPDLTGEGVAIPADEVVALQTEGDAPPEAARPTPIMMTISGGASLGAYEAGLSYFSVEAFRNSPERVRPMVFAGTSAGSINSFIAALSYCSEAPRDPEASAFFRTWAAVGISDLYDPDRVQANAIFTRDAFERVVGNLRQTWDRGLRDDCDLLLGVTVTRLRPRDVVVEEGVLSLPRMAERFLVRIQGRGPGQPPLVRNYVEGSLGLERPLLPLDGPDVDAFGSLVQATLASAAFPVGFAPQTIAHCIQTDRDGGDRCTVEDAEDALFLDGGFYANQPLGLAVDAARTGITESGPLAILDEPTRSDHLPPDSLFYFVDPEFNAFPTPTDQEEEQEVQDVIPYALGLAGDFIRTARMAELESVLEHVPATRKLLFTNRVHYPPASTPLGAFMGFFDAEFRRFDFHLGMYDARRTLLERTPNIDNEELMRLLPDEASRHEDDLGWRPFDCMRHVFDGEGPARVCAGEHLHDFRILIRLSLERLYNVCLRSDAYSTMCDAARDGQPPPDVPYVEATGQWRSHEDEAHYDWMLRRLGTLGFAYRDLGLSASESHLGGDRVRVLLADMTRRLARSQEDLGLPIELAAEAVVNMLQYRAPRNLVHVGMGTGLEIGWSGTIPGTAWEPFRLTASLGFRGFGSLVSSNPSWFGIAPQLGVEVEILPWSGGIFQPRLGIRGGYLLSTADGMASSPCNVSLEETLPCSRPIVQGYVDLSFFQILHLLLIVEVAPAVRPNEADMWDLSPGLRVSMPFE